MKSYDLPQTEGLSPEEARAVLERVYNDAGGDLQHPYSDARHPRHKRFVRAMMELHTAAAHPPPEPALALSDEERADLAAQIAVLEGTPGYITGRLRQESLAAHTRLLGKIHVLYERVAQGRQAAERAVAAAAEAARPDAEEVADDELAQAAERVQRAEQDAAAGMAEKQEMEESDDDDGLL